MKTKKQFLVGTIMFLIRTFFANEHGKQAIHFSFLEDDKLHVHILIVRKAYTINVFATAIGSRLLVDLDDSTITQYACSTGGVLHSQVEGMVKDLFAVDTNIEYGAPVKLFDVEFEGECDLGADFKLSANGNRIELKYM